MLTPVYSCSPIYSCLPMSTHRGVAEPGPTQAWARASEISNNYIHRLSYSVIKFIVFNHACLVNIHNFPVFY